LTFTVRLRRAAELDVEEAQIWYEEQQAGLAEDFNHEVDAVMARLAEAPLIYPVVHREVRRAVLHRFPFLVWYQVLGSTVLVLACTHGRADPRKVTAKLR
jgi:plasmid stabilization system protein ParE